MANWFECKVKYDRPADNGALKTVNESYLVDALSFTEAEARITEEVSSFSMGEFSVAAVKRVKLAEVFFNENGDKWYKVKVAFITIDEKTAVEKRVACFMLVQAGDIEAALKNFTEGMRGTMGDYEVSSIVETPIMDVYNANLSETLADKAAKAAKAE